jgi:hypothetical protein
MNTFGERNYSFLVALLSAVHMDNGLLRLRGKNVRIAHSNAVGRSRTLLEDMSLSSQWLMFVDEDTRILRDTRVRFRRRGYRGYELFGQHPECACGWMLRASELFQKVLVERVCAPLPRDAIIALAGSYSAHVSVSTQSQSNVCTISPLTTLPLFTLVFILSEKNPSANCYVLAGAASLASTCTVCTPP